MKGKILTVAIICICTILGIGLGIRQVSEQKEIHFLENFTLFQKHPSKVEEMIPDSDEIVPTPTESITVDLTTKEEEPIRAIYVTGWSIGTKNVRESIIQNIKNNGFNAIVIDIKDEEGQLTYDSKVQTAIDIGASKKMVLNIENVLKELHDNDIYVIGRIVTFKDPILAGDANTVVAYRTEDGKTWKDYNGNFWPNPYNKNSWEYPLALAKEAAKLGFDEIQFDYLRFPKTEGKVSEIAYGFDSKQKTKADIICDFLEEAMDQLKEYPVKVSATVQGATTKKTGDYLDIGQDFERIAKIVNYICPTIFPSDYSDGEYGLTKPDTHPYEITLVASKDALNRIGIPNKIRPYLQDFTATWLGEKNYIVYSTDEVAAQLKAIHENKITSFCLWDPAYKYCFDALNKIQK